MMATRKGKEPKENKMNSHIDKMVECLIEAYKHAVNGFKFELEYRRHPRGLEELLEAIDNVLADANTTKVRHHEDLREHRFLKAKLGEIIEDLVELREATYNKLNGK